MYNSSIPVRPLLYRNLTQPIKDNKAGNDQPSRRPQRFSRGPHRSFHQRLFSPARESIRHPQDHSMKIRYSAYLPTYLPM